MRNFKHSIKHVVFGWLYNKEVEPIDIARSLDDYYGINHRNTTNPHELLNVLGKNCIDEELAINWAISKLYDRFKTSDNDEKAKDKTIEIVEELLNHFKQAEV